MSIATAGAAARTAVAVRRYGVSGLRPGPYLDFKVNPFESYLSGPRNNACSSSRSNHNGNMTISRRKQRIPNGGEGGIEGVQEVPVVISGAGPTGLTMSLLLAKYGVRHVVLERTLGPTQHPQAHFINNRTMEIFRSLGLTGPVRRLMPPLEEWRRFVYCESVAGRVYGDVDHFQGQSSPLSAHLSPEPVAHLPQHRLLRLMLQRHAEVAKAPEPQSALITVLHEDGRLGPPGDEDYAHGAGGAVSWGASLCGVSYSGQELSAASASAAAGGADVVVEVDLAAPSDAPAPRPGDLKTHKRRTVLRCQYLVAADGAHSGVRAMVGGQMQGEGALQHLINAHFTSRALSRLAASRPAMLYFVFNPEVVAVLVAHDIGSGEFVAQIPYFPPLQSPADFPPHRVAQLIRNAIGRPATSRGGPPEEDVDVQLLQLRAWTMTAEVADRFAFGSPADSQSNGADEQGSSVDGGKRGAQPQILLVGDAAHRFPPAGGFGMNTGVQDAGNLAWKLAAVLQGLAGAKLLHSYETERRPIALANTGLSVRNWGEATRVPAALGLDPRVANTVNQLVTNAVPLPQWARKGLLEAALDLGRRLAGPEGVPLPLLGSWRQQQVQRILSSGASLRLQYPAEDLGFTYGKGALVAQWKSNGASSRASEHSSESAADATTAADAAARLPPRGAPYNPSSAPGCRLPHCWLHLVQTHGSPQKQAAVSSGDAGMIRGALEMGPPTKPHILVVMSTLDVIADPWVGPRLLLFTDGHLGTGDNPWLTAALQLYGQLPGASRQADTSTAATSAAEGALALPLVVVQVLPAVNNWADGAVGPGRWQPSSTAQPDPVDPAALVVHEPPSETCWGATWADTLAGAAGTGHSALTRYSDDCRRDQGGRISGGGSGSYIEISAPPLSHTGAAGLPGITVRTAPQFLAVMREAEPGGWLRTMGLPPGSCLIVRPDGHVAWRHFGPPRRHLIAGAVAADTASGALSTPVHGALSATAEAAAAVAIAASELRTILAALHWRMP